MMSTTNEIIMKAYTAKELAAMYGISARTFKGWLEPHLAYIGEKKGWYFTVLQVRVIFEKLGVPDHD